MNNTIEISRELLMILADLNCPYDQLMAAKQRAAEILIAPVVELQDRRDMAAEVHLMKRESTPPLIQTLHANDDRIAMEVTIAQQAQRIADLERGRGEPFMYGIMQPDGKPHYSELCVSGEASDLESEVECMNEGEDPGYRVVALYAEQPAPVAVDIESAAQKLASCMDYPWEHMPEQGRESMREHAKAIINAACLDKIKELNQ